jgi:flavorubredoxin
MKITKITHCTLLFEFGNGSRVLVDPGKFAINEYSSLTELEYLVITDIHQDHYKMDGVKALLGLNPGMKLIVTDSVKQKLEGDFTEISQSIIVVTSDLSLEIGDESWTFGVESHIPAYKDVLKPEKILWYQIAHKYFGSGDTYALPKEKVELMGQNVIAPFGSMEKFIDHAIEARPKKVFNIHDGYLNKDFTIGFYGFVKKYLEENGIEYEFLEDGDVISV